MKRELAYVLEVQSQLVGSLGQNRSCITHSPPETKAACCTEAESVCPKRIRVAEVNGFIVYTRLKKSRINGCSKLRENPVNGRIKSLEEPKLDSTASSIVEKDRGTDNVPERNRELDKEIQENHLVDSGIEAGIVAEAVNKKEPNGSVVEEVGVELGNADCKENVLLLRQLSGHTLKMKVTMEAADGRESSIVEHISRSEQSTADKEGVVEAPLKFMESSKPPRRFTRSALKLMEEKVEVTVHGREVIDSRSNCRAICAIEPISRSEQSPSDKEGLDEAPLNFTECSKPPRRFTRSALKPKEEPVEVTVHGMEAVDREATCRIDVEMIAEGSALATPKKNLELKMSKKISLEKKPTTVKELFETGLLEGVPVIYMGGKKAFGLRGTIKEVGILCSCSLCRGYRVIPPSQFEIHACNQYRRAAQYVCFENGKSLLDVLKACRAAPLHELETTIQSAISSAEDRSFICIKCKGSFSPSFVGKLGPLCISCTDSKESGDGPSCAIDNIRTRLPEPEPESDLIAKLPKSDSTFDSPQHSEVKITRKSSKTDLLAITYKSASVHKSSRLMSQWKTTQKSIKTGLITKAPRSASVPISSKGKSQQKSAPMSSKPAVVPKSFKNASASISLQNKCQWKLTTKDQRLHKLVFEEGGLPDGTEVAYYGRGQKMLEGYKKGFGIFCRCCNCEVSPSQFEVHAGWASRKKPYSYIYLSNGVSLHELAISLSKGRKYSAKDNDDVCVICADGGNLLLCDGCPRAFHKDCASLSSVPRGDWYCKYCENMFQREKFVEHNANAIAAGRVSGIDPIEQLTKRCIRIVKSIEQELSSGCVICRRYDFSKSGFGPRTVIICDQCEKEYHVGCLKTHKIANLKELPKGKWFCCVDCSKIHSTLQKLLSCGAERLPDSFFNILKKKHEEKGLGTVTDIDVRWRLLSSKMPSSETRSLLSQAVGIFHECFDPIVDSATGRDLIPYMVYGRNLKGQEYGGMHCAILTVNSTVVSAGILRVFGREVAELPLVATSNDNHGKGYFQLLFSCIEKLLGVLNVKSLVLPAATEAESIWTDRFGFQKIKPDQLSRYRKSCCQMVTFQGTSMLHKSIPACSIVNKSKGGFIESCCAVE